MTSASTRKKMASKFDLCCLGLEIAIICIFTNFVMAAPGTPILAAGDDPHSNEQKRTPKQLLAVMAAASFVFSAGVLLVGKISFFLSDVPISKAVSVTESKSSHPTSSSTHTAIPQDNLWTPSDLRWFDLCGSLKQTVIQVASMLQDPFNQTTNSSWTPPILHCDQLVRSLPNITWWYPTSTASSMAVDSRSSSSNKRLFHLFHKNNLAVVSRLNRGEPVKIVVIGGSMTAGDRDDIHFASQEEAKEGAWPRKLELLLRQFWPKSLITVENLARPGWSQNHWLSSFHVITQQIAPFDLMLAEFAVNDQCDYDEQEVCRKNSNETSHILLNNLLSLPNKPAVMLVEMFRLAFDSEDDAEEHCGEHRQVIPNSTTWVSVPSL